MFDKKKDTNKPKEPKIDRDHDLTCLSLHFLDQFLSLSFFEIFWCFSWFRKLPMDPNWCFFMLWWSRDQPRLILDRFGKSHFFMKIFKILSHMSGFLPWKLMCISITWSIWEYPDLEQLKTQKPNETYQILPNGCWEKQKTKLKNTLNQAPKISWKFSIRGNYSWAYLL